VCVGGVCVCEVCMGGICCVKYVCEGTYGGGLGGLWGAPIKSRISRSRTPRLRLCVCVCVFVRVCVYVCVCVCVCTYIGSEDGACRESPTIYPLITAAPQKKKERKKIKYKKDLDEEHAMKVPHFSRRKWQRHRKRISQ
jgi:hypothetical protein